MKRTLMYRCCIAALMLFVSVASFAQKTNIGGTVVSATNEPIVGAAIIDLATKEGVVTDIDGKFTLNTTAGANLEVSCLGYETVKVQAKDGMTITLVEAVNMMEETVLVGYTTQRKSDLTGSVTVVSVEDIKKSPAVDVMTALQGRVPGMSISSTGDPSSQASIQIRGIGSLNNTDPLYIVDGMPTTQGIKDINASDIESIQVLKDAASASIYGSRAANGVIIVTTNKGREGNVKVNFNASVQVQNYARRVELCNTEQLGEVIYRAFKSAGLDPNSNALGYKFDSNGKMVPTEFLGSSTNMKPADTDWWDEITQTALRQTYELSLSNGNKRGNYYFSLGITDGNGVIKNSDYTRYNARLNSSYNFFNGILTIGENLTVSNSSGQGLADNYGSSGNVLQIATQSLPIVPVHTIDGEGWGGPVDGMCDRMNPARIVDAAKNNSNSMWRIFGSAYVDIKPIKNLSIRSTFSPEFITSFSRTFRYPYSEGFLSNSELSTSITQNTRTNWTWSNTITYNLELGDHRATFLLGNEMIRNKRVTFFQKTQGYEIQDPNYMWPDAATGSASVSGNEISSSLSSFFGKIDYSYKNRYLIGLTVRRDGSSKFGKDQQFATFPSVSAGWRISNEKFLRDVNWIQDLKIRASWGTNGNQEIQDGAIYTLYDTLYGATTNPTWSGMNGTSYDIAGADTGSLSSGYRRTQQGNSMLKWEQSEQWDAGFDFTFFNYKLYGSFDWFLKNPTDILIKPTVIAAAGEGSSRYENGASMKNTGFEFLIGSRGESSFGLKYDVSANFSNWRNTVTYLPASVLAEYGGNGTTDTILGRCLGSYYGWTESGLYKSEADLNNGVEHTGKGLGRIKWDDNNGDGKIDLNDRVWFGSPEPLFSFGLNVSLAYKGFDFSMFWEGKAGWVALTPTKAQTDFYAVSAEGTNRGVRILDAWTPENSSSNIPAIAYSNDNDEGRVSTYLYEDHSFAKLRNIQLGYTFNFPSFKKVGLDRFRIYVTGQNLLQITSKKFTGVDPEQTSYSYPLPMTFTAGLQLSF